MSTTQIPTITALAIQTTLHTIITDQSNLISMSLYIKFITKAYLILGAPLLAGARAPSTFQHLGSGSFLFPFILFTINALLP